MPSWISTILLTVTTTLVVGLVVTPRLEARNRRIRLSYEARDEFSRHVLTILSACGRLQNTPISAALTEQRPALAERLNGERQRWIDQLDEATRYLVDNMETFGLGYPTDRVRAIVGEFVINARGVVLSERSVDKQAERLSALAAPVQNIFFTRRWRLTTIVQSFVEFDQAVAALNEDLPDGQVPRVAAPGAGQQPS
ncbi:hypothetical protein [Streptomyces decoyicus]|uniref:hypothetical protein n=1 Tax=Streptomyces decoyicus TaxID=249567 RepID=UPI00364F05EC